MQPADASSRCGRAEDAGDMQLTRSRWPELLSVGRANAEVYTAVFRRESVP